MLEFILNNELIQTVQPPGLPLLDLIRYHSRLTGTKVGCREGDCGACMVLEGCLEGETVRYKTIVSCLRPISQVHGKHIVTVEGVREKELSPAQQAIVDHSGTQCGFCTPGFVMALTGATLSDEPLSETTVIASMDGNLCRCTGYQSLKNAAIELSGKLPETPSQRPIPWLVANGFLPEYFLGIRQRLNAIPIYQPESGTNGKLVVGGTDLMVQQPDPIYEQPPQPFPEKYISREIYFQKGEFWIGGGATTTDILRNTHMRTHFPELENFGKLIASEPIRNMGTLGGNLVNASPIADLSIFFLALDPVIRLAGKGGEREMPLRSFFLDYKKLNLKQNEFVAGIRFKAPEKDSFFNFEKVSKRRYLDIASVNSAIYFTLSGNCFQSVNLSAGGVSPVPLFLHKTAGFLKGRTLSTQTLLAALDILQTEIRPISDIRGSEGYKRLLLRQLFLCHFERYSSGSLDLQTLMNQDEKY